MSSARRPPARRRNPAAEIETLCATWLVFAKAVEAGAKQLQPVEDKFYGERTGSFEDPFGHRWHVAGHAEDVPPDEMEKRITEAMATDSG